MYLSILILRHHIFTINNIDFSGPLLPSKFASQKFKIIFIDWKMISILQMYLELIFHIFRS